MALNHKLPVLFIAAAAAGCGNTSLPTLKTYDVKGKVVLAQTKEPLKTGTVEFEPAGGGYNCTGEIQPDGSFTLVTFNGNQRLAGVAEGEYRVTVNGVQDATQVPRSVVYAKTIKIDPQTTDVTIELDKFP
jgi:hypothetical protein